MASSALHTRLHLRDLDQSKKPIVLAMPFSVPGAPGGKDLKCGAAVFDQPALPLIREPRPRIRELHDAVRINLLPGARAEFSTYSWLLQECGRLNALAAGKLVHAHIRSMRLEHDRFLGNLVVDMYGRCGRLDEAAAAFQEIHEKNVFSWNIWIGANAMNGQSMAALELLKKMELHGIKATRVTFLNALSACAAPELLAQARSIVEKITAAGMDRDVLVATAVVSAYARCGAIASAREVFDAMPARNIVSWNAMIEAYAQHGRGADAIAVFRLLELEGTFQANKITFLALIEACSCSWQGNLGTGRLFHRRAIASGFHTDESLKNSLVNMYSKCGSVEEARQVFDSIAPRTAISCSVMITTLAQNGFYREALELYREMQEEGLESNNMTFLSLLEASANLTALGQGRRIHASIIDYGLARDLLIQTALMYMYGKCAGLDEAREVFESMERKNVVAWTSIIAAYSQHGHCEESLELFRRMALDGVMPNEVTYGTLLSTCSHAGLVDEAYDNFVEMKNPRLTHYRCMVDALGRAGKLDEAEDLLNNMPFEPDSVAWVLFLGACKTHGSIERGSRAAESIREVAPESAMLCTSSCRGMILTLAEVDTRDA
ncbi:pentatricopeptide repeat-containing protein At1g11290, chloroplastic isoform X1 [Selaginella moellendorffii]|uniref:pentatricopeptide repeat-containing protein At1g11290, chloroplastic isoform X1 n=1 Tax=Selaginella moellendorffii TaxID=88036 RepID=UPI000D1C8870|nr:pentatricopeptide repeat-containing protein At1g11290, chloroplastic isoform X1 [Selaginella moellendorffii]|eukprot:XP_002980145.2 pentatricopeptide repeat-containing protein At1g11290, chloroplastic isoform X1 [Selaginella moellendorffii]